MQILKDQDEYLELLGHHSSATELLLVSYFVCKAYVLNLPFLGVALNIMSYSISLCFAFNLFSMHFIFTNLLNSFYTPASNNLCQKYF